MKTKQLAQWGLLLIALLSLLSPYVTVQAQQPTSEYGPPTWPYQIYPGSIPFGGSATWDFFDLHGGEDLWAPAGTPVYATCSGKVVWWDDWPWQGAGSLVNVIWIDCHDGNYEGFAHLDDQTNHAVAGQDVLVGQQIAVTGPIERSGVGTDDHLHHTRTKVDPRTVDRSNFNTLGFKGLFVDPTVGVDYSRSPEQRLAEVQQAQTLVTKVYNMKSNYRSYPIYRANMLMTFWGVSPGSKFRDAYLSVPSDFEGQVEIPKGITWLNGNFGPYTYEYGMGTAEVGGVKEGGGACDILSMVAETLDSVDKVTVDSYSPHPSPIPGVASKYSLAVATDKNLADPTTKNGADVRVVNDYGAITLHWKVDGDTLTLWATTGSSTMSSNQSAQPTNSVANTGDSNVSLFQSLQSIAGWILVGITILLAVFALPRAILRIGKPKSQGEVSEHKWLWKGIIETEIVVGIILVIGAYFYANSMWPDIVANRRRVLLDFFNGTSQIPNLWIIAVLLFWLTSSLLRRYRQAQQVMVTTKNDKSKGKLFVFVTIVVVGSLLGVYFFPNLYVPKPPVKAEDQVPAGSCDGVLFTKLMQGSPYLGAVPPEVRWTTLDTAISKITPALEAVYKEAERQTGVPCEVLASIHFVEANNRANGSLISGRAIGVPEPDQGGKIYSSLLETAVDAAKVLKVKAGLPKDTYAEFTSAEQLITALSDYNGKGNRNCQDSYTVNGAVVKIPYTGCPALFKGEDHPSVMNWLDSKHATMYLLYCADYTACAPQVWKRPGYLTVANWFYTQVTSRRTSTSSTPTAPP